MQLKSPSLELVTSYLDFTQEMADRGEKVWENCRPWAEESPADFVNRLLRSETAPLPGLVAESTFWCVADGRVLGRIALRHELNEQLEKFGGHIGYEVRPSARRQGLATEMLAQLLKTPKAKSIGRLLLTCAPDNLASNKTIQKNGGVLSKTEFVEKWQRLTNYYWITP